MLTTILLFLGGISLFIFGLKLISEISVILSKGKPKLVMQRLLKPKAAALVTGIAVSSISQSSVIVNVLAIEFVEKGVLSLASAFAVIMGANVGTTVTAQLVSSSGLGGEVVGAISSLVGIILLAFKSEKSKVLGKSLLGLGVLFSGLSALSNAITVLSRYKIIKNLFLIKNPIVLFLNGVILTAVVQSSSAITGVLVLLANAGLISFQSSVFLILGSNVGSCFVVLLFSFDKCLYARKTAWFNLLFNLLGAMVFFLVFCAFSSLCSELFLKGKTVGRAIANFHTVFNLICTVFFFPFIGFFEKILSQKPKIYQKSAKKFLL